MKLLKDFAIQLYSVKDATDKDFPGTLEKLGNRGFGYTGVEFAGYGGLSADEMKKALSDNGLTAIGSHVGTDRLLNNLDEEIAYNKAVGSKYIICPYAEMETKEDVLALAEALTPVAEKVTAAGLKFAYHNHAHEFAMDGGEYLLDILFDNLPADAVMELDVFWNECAGVETLGYMEKHKSRIEVLHLKQIDSNKNNVDFDQGMLDFWVIIQKAKKNGIKYFVMEQEEYDVSPMASAENNVKFILNLEEND